MWPSILQTGSVLIAALSVVLGISAWRRTLLGQKRFDLAEQVAVGFAEARTALGQIRSPASFGGEGSSRPRSENETEEMRQVLDQAYVAIERYNKSEAFSKLLPLRHRFELYFGEEAARPFSELEEIVWEIIFAARKLERLWPRQGKPMTAEQFERHLKEMHAAEAIFWAGSEDPDPLTPRIDKMVRDINTTCRAIINPRHDLCTVVRGWLTSTWKFIRCGQS